MLRFLLLVLIAVPAMAQGNAVLIENARIFNGVDDELTRGHVLVVERVIRTISTDVIPAPDGTVVVDAGGRVLSPGFSDLHAHLRMQNPIESGTIAGPRVFPSGAIVSQTAGHGDFRQLHESHPVLNGVSPSLLGGKSILADGADATAQLVADSDVVISTQLVVFRTAQDMSGVTENNLEKLRQVLAGQENLIRLIKKYDVTTGFAWYAPLLLWKPRTARCYLSVAMGL